MALRLTRPAASSDSATSPKVITVPVAYEEGTLTAPGNVDVEPTTATVEWNFDALFAALGDGWQLGAQFQNQGAQSAAVGPFQSLRTADRVVLGEGNSGRRGEFGYYLSAHRPGSSAADPGETITGGPFQLTNQSEDAVSGTVVPIRIQAAVDGAGGLALTATTGQEEVSYLNGDVLVFQFFGLPDGAVPEMSFLSYEAAGASDLEVPGYPYGPFSSLTWVPSSKQWIGAGESGGYGTWEYALDLVVLDDAGAVTRYAVALEPGEDPVIDSEDYPVPP